MQPLSIFVVDDEKNIRRSFEIILKPKGFSIQTYESGESVLKALEKNQPDVIFLDVMMPGIDGIETLKRIKKNIPNVDVVMISGHANLSTAVDATRAGAYDFLEKPLQKEKILLTLKHLQERQQLETRFSHLQASISENYQIVGESPEILGVLKTIQKVAPTDSKVLITGPSGAGKELVAYHIHQHSQRVKGAFIKLNCAAIPEDLIESELFGSEKGAFTGATERRDGKFLQANLGTLFLDEIGDMSLRVQTKVLRVLQDGEFQRVGGKEVLKADVRVVAATNKNLSEMVTDGTFREDLYFRLNVIPIEVPPLSARSADVIPLTQFFIQRFCQKNNRRVPVVKDVVYRALKQYYWPGNIRELQNLTERLLILADNDVIDINDLPEYLYQPQLNVKQIAPGSKTLNEVREQAEREYINNCLKTTGGNVSQTARLLGMERTNLHKKMKALGIR